MNSRKLIIGGAAILVTLGSTLAFKAPKFGTKKVDGLTVPNNRICKQCITLWTDIHSGIQVGSCKSAAGGTLIAPGTKGWATNLMTCDPVVTKVTHTKCLPYRRVKNINLWIDKDDFAIYLEI
jgi:hypothetical protein